MGVPRGGAAKARPYTDAASCDFLGPQHANQVGKKKNENNKFGACKKRVIKNIYEASYMIIKMKTNMKMEMEMDK